MPPASPRGTIPIRRWLVIALVLIVLVPVVVTILVGIVFLHRPWESGLSASERLSTDVARWHDPAWQAAMTADLSAQGVDFILVEDGREVYRSAADPFISEGPGRPGRVVQRYEIPGSDPSSTAVVYTVTDQAWGGEGRVWLLPLVLITTLLATLAGIAWFIRRTVLDPLAATTQATREVASGNLDVDLPSSRVREVAAVNMAFESMTEALRTSLQQQAQLEQERRLFISAIVHDLRTPLFSLRGYLEGFEKGIADTPQKSARYIAVAQEKAAALERLISDLFDYTRLEYLDQAPDQERLDLAVILRELVDALQPQSELKRVALTVDSVFEPCWVDADRHLLMRAIENLLDNALRFTPSGGEVRVACQSRPSGATFTVTDSGPGLPEHDLPHLFTPLYRGETSRNRRTGGAGLGLTIARRILLAHGGDLTAGNRPEGGAVFTGTLPAPAHEPRASAAGV